MENQNNHCDDLISYLAKEAGLILLETAAAQPMPHGASFQTSKAALQTMKEELVWLKVMENESTAGLSDSHKMNWMNRSGP